MRRLLSAACLLAALTLAFAAPAAGQAAPKGDVAISYSVLYDKGLGTDSSGVGGWMPAGWVIAGSVRVSDRLSIVGEAGANYKPLTFEGVSFTLDSYTFLGGVKYAARANPKVSPFVQLLAGVARYRASALGVSASADAFAAQIGGGGDITLTARVAIRVQGDLRVIRAGTPPPVVNGTRDIGDEYGSEFRFATGVVYRF